MADSEASKATGFAAGGGPPAAIARAAGLGRQRLVGLLCAAVNHLLASEPAAERRLSAHVGRRIGVALPAPEPAVDATVVLVVTAPGRLQLDEGPDGARSPAAAVDLRIELDPARALALLAEGAPVAAAARIDGDAALAGDVGWLFAHLRWDVEDELSRWVGDLAAREMAEGGRQLAGLLRRGVDDGVDLLRRGLSEPQAPLLARPAHAALRAEVAELRDAVARLEARLVLLERRRPAC